MFRDNKYHERRLWGTLRREGIISVPNQDDQHTSLRRMLEKT